MTQPDKVDQRLGQAPATLKLPNIGAALGENVIPTLPVDLHFVAGEAERRAALLTSVTVDKRGIAHCVSPDSSTSSHLAVVLLDAQRPAALARLQVVDEQTVGLIFPERKPVRIGFFLGHTSDSEISAAFRMGLYPGQPLVTEALTDENNQEVHINVANIKLGETQEQAAADALNLFGELGFIRGKTRGVFYRFHRPNRYLDTWKSWDLVVFPDEQIGTVRHFSSAQVRNNTFQTLFYSCQKQPDLDELLPTSRGNSYRGLYLGGEEPTKSYTLGLPTRGLKGAQVGFGREATSQAKVTGMRINELLGAFQVAIGYQE